jgi:glycerophosphoryl diester phosphodiesterase
MTAPQIIAHQGGKAEWPANSRLAFESVKSLSVDAVELDVHLTKDGQVLVLHDATIEMNGARVPVQKSTSDEARQSYQTLGGAISLEEVLSLFSDSSFDVQIDIKTDVYGIDYTGLNDLAASIISKSGIGERVIVSSFLPATLHDFRRLLPDVRLRAGLMPLVTEQLGGAFQAISTYQKVGVTYIDGNVRMLDQRIIDYAISKGMIVGVGTVNGQADLRYWMAQPVARILTDEPSIAIALRDESFGSDSN